MYWAPAFDTGKTRRSNDLEIRSAPVGGTDKLGNNTICWCWWLLASRCSRVRLLSIGTDIVAGLHPLGAPLTSCLNDNFGLGAS